MLVTLLVAEGAPSSRSHSSAAIQPLPSSHHHHHSRHHSRHSVRLAANNNVSSSHHWVTGLISQSVLTGTVAARVLQSYTYWEVCASALSQDVQVRPISAPSITVCAPRPT